MMEHMQSLAKLNKGAVLAFRPGVTALANKVRVNVWIDQPSSIQVDVWNDFDLESGIG